MGGILGQNGWFYGHWVNVLIFGANAFVVVV